VSRGFCGEDPFRRETFPNFDKAHKARYIEFSIRGCSLFLSPGCGHEKIWLIQDQSILCQSILSLSYYEDCAMILI